MTKELNSGRWITEETAFIAEEVSKCVHGAINPGEVTVGAVRRAEAALRGALESRQLISGT